MREKIIDDYFNWLYSIVCQRGKRSVDTRYQRLLSFLFDTEFYYSLEMDGNREEDGINLRYRFGDENGVSQVKVATFLDDRECSVLEMMIALCVRCEEHITYDADAGDNTSRLFWGMLENLGLAYMDDVRFDLNKARAIVSRLLEREYEPDGRGGLFTVRNARDDMRTVDIWYQMMWYLAEKYS